MCLFSLIMFDFDQKFKNMYQSATSAFAMHIQARLTLTSCFKGNNVWSELSFFLFRLHTRTGPKGLQITGITWRTASISPGVADSYGKMATVKTSITLSVKPFCNSCSGQYTLHGTFIIYTVQLFFQIKSRCVQII